jgi:hypothetical protein
MLRWSRLIVCSKLAATAIAMLLLAGCNLVPTEKGGTIQQSQRENVSQNATSDFAREFSFTPTPVTVDMKSGVVTVPPTVQQEVKAAAAVGEDSQSRASAEANWYQSIPLGVKLIMLAIGAMMLLGVFWIIRRSSATVNAAYKAADELMAKAIHRVRSEGMNAQDGKAFAILAGDLERERTEWHKEP